MSKVNTRATINANIKQNGNQEITGQVLNSVLNTMVDDYAEQEKLTELESDKVSYTHIDGVKNGYILLEDGIRLGGVNEGTSVHSAIYYKVKPSSKLKFITDYLVVIYEYDINKNYLRGSSWYSKKEYYLVGEDTNYVRIGYRDNSGLTRDNFKKETCFYFDVLNEDVSLISKNIVVNPYVINKYKSKVVLVDDGTFKTVSPRWTVMKYAVNNVTKIKVTSKQDDNKSAVAAFYTEDDIYIRDGSVSAKQVNKEVSYEIAVPENANYVLCSSADIEPIVETDNIGKVVNGLCLEISNQLQQLGGELHSLPVARLSQRFEYHYFMGNRRGIIPPQSIFDLNVAKRLGFNSIELNVQVTSDNVLIVMHGSGGKFAYEVVDLNGDNTYADTPISSVTYQWIQDNLRYSSIVPKYRTKIITLEEALTEAKRIGLYVTLYMATDYIYEECVRLLEKYQDMPSYGVYSLASGINLRGMTKGVITHYSVADTIEKIINECELIGAPYIHAMANEILVDNNGLKWSDDELSQIVEAVHGRGCYLACAASYLPEDIQQHLWKLGFDYAGSGWSVNPFDSGNILNTGFDLYANVSDWETDGIIEGYTFILSDGNAITLKEQEYMFLGKGYLTLLFNGKVNIKLGEVNVDLVSDGSEIIEVSSYYLDRSPNLIITSIGTTEIQSFTFKLSKC